MKHPVWIALFMLMGCPSGGPDDDTGNIGKDEVTEDDIDTDVPDTDLPDTDVPDTDLPDTDVPDTDLPDTDVPDTDLPDTDTDVPDTDLPDFDGDGFSADIDCDDGDELIHPGADELCNGIDDDCDLALDNNAVDAPTWFADVDNDTFGDPATTIAACGAAPSGYVGNDSDCDDSDDEINPDALELCNGIDEDCDSEEDEEAIDAQEWFPDVDSDTFGDRDSGVLACTQPSGFIADGRDCDDGDDDVNPNATEACNGVDDDCDDVIDDGLPDPSTWFRDSDNDGFGDPDSTVTACAQPRNFVADATDCDDGDELVHPSADERCNEVDDDCDEDVDEDAVDPRTWFADADEDTYGDPAVTASACVAPQGYVADDSDCDDADEDIHPEQLELCNDIDDDCDAATDEDAIDAPEWFSDLDRDRFGDPGASEFACIRPEGTVENDDDCDDNEEAIHPDADEVCNGVDDDCDGDIDGGAVDAPLWYADTDSDGFGDATASMPRCAAPGGHVADFTDCDDADELVNPEADELCNQVDDDCDDEIDEAALDAPTWFSDADEDTYGDAAVSATGCVQPRGFVADATDCDDEDEAVNPGEPEVCNDVDDDCDGDVDGDAIDAPEWFVDADHDRFGDASRSEAACIRPEGMVEDATDCDDDDDSVHPGADEVCNDVDDDCDDAIDDAAVDAPVWFSDADRDGYGDPRVGTFLCTEPAGSVADATDCDDADELVNPGAIEVCNEVDDDCDDEIDEDAVDASTWFADADADTYGDAATTTTTCVMPSGYVADAGDCDDDDDHVNPGEIEVCNEVDDDCDDAIDEDAADATEWFADVDADTYGDGETGAFACTQPEQTVADNTDCDDDDDAVHPGADEVCNDRDDDCDDSIDDAAIDAPLWFNDADSDGYGDPRVGTFSCTQPSGAVADFTDCNDGETFVNPGADELCNDVDDDCDDEVDEDPVAGQLHYPDADADGYGDPNGTTRLACPDYPPDGYVTDGYDCNDQDEQIHPDADELCNGVDDNCDDVVDLDAVDRALQYADADADGFGDDDDSVFSCPVEGRTTTLGDCDDENEDVNPDATELCATPYDDDCDGSLDDGRDPQAWYVDQDGDGFGTPGEPIQACAPPAGTINNDDDCNDAYELAYPGALELCDDAQNNCSRRWDPVVEEGLVSFRSAAGAWSNATAGFRGRVTLQSGDYFICPGVHTVQLTAPTGTVVSLTGVGGRDAVFLDANGVSRVVTSTADMLDIEGLTLRSGEATDGGGLSASTGVVTIVDSEITDNVAETFGGGLYIYGSAALIMVDSSVVANFATRGAGLAVTGPWTELNAVEFLDNAAQSTTMSATGGGVHAVLDPDEFLRLDQTGMLRNTSDAGAGGMFVSGGIVELDGVSIGQNTSGAGGVGGLQLAGGVGSCTAVDSAISHNRGATGGLSITSGGELSFQNLHVTGNVATTLAGGILVQRPVGAPQITMADGAISNNRTTGSGGGIRISAGEVSLDGTVIQENEAGTSGGGVHLSSTSATALFSDVDVSDNTVTSATGLGAGIYVEAGVLDADVSEIHENGWFASPATGSMGGGLAGGVSAQVTLRSTYVWGNRAGFGGGWYGDGQVSMRGGSLLQGNRADTTGGGAYIYGGSFTCGDGVAGSSAGIIGNTATGGGAGVAMATAGFGFFEAIVCDFGVTGTADDNTTIAGGGQDASTTITFPYGNDASFVCNNSGCVP